MSGAVEKYKILLNKLIYVRWIHNGMESDQEDNLLEEMDSVWEDLTEAEKDLIQTIPSRSFINTGTDRVILDTKLSTGPKRAIFDSKEAV